MNSTHQLKTASSPGPGRIVDPAASRSAGSQGFRTELRTVSETEIKVLNNNEGRTGAMRYRPAELELERIATCRPRSRKQLDCWAMHPDERVPIALLQSILLKPHTRKTESIAIDLVMRALRESGTDIWTPLFDALSDSGHWPEEEWEFISRTHANTVEATWPTMGQYLAECVVPWIKAQTDPAVLIALAQAFKAASLLRTIAEHARVWNIALIDQLLARHPMMSWWLARRGSELPRFVGERLVEYIVRQTISLEASRVANANEPSLIRTLIPSYNELQGKGWFLTQDHIDALFQSIHARAKHASEGDGKAQQRAASGEFALLLEFILATNSEEIALRYVEAAARANELWVVPPLLRFMNLPRSAATITPKLGRAVVKWLGDSVDVCVSLARQPGPRNDPEIRAHLLRSDSLKVAEHLLEDPRPEDFARLFRLIAPRDPWIAAVALEKNPDLARATLNESDLLPLLQAADRDVRLKAVVLLGELKNRTSSPQRQGSSMTRA